MTDDYKPYKSKDKCIEGLRVHNREIHDWKTRCDGCPYEGYEIHNVGLFGVDEVGDCMYPLLKDAEYYLTRSDVE